MGCLRIQVDLHTQFHPRVIYQIHLDRLVLLAIGLAGRKIGDQRANPANRFGRTVILRQCTEVHLAGGRHVRRAVLHDLQRPLARRLLRPVRHQVVASADDLHGIRAAVRHDIGHLGAPLGVTEPTFPTVDLVHIRAHGQRVEVLHQ